VSTGVKPAPAPPEVPTLPAQPVSERVSNLTTGTAAQTAPVVTAQPILQPVRATSRARSWVRRLHALVGLIAALNLLLLLGTGLLLQHRDVFRLDERMVSRRVLPRSYRPQDGEEGVRADIVTTDLHSGRLLGRTGALVLDAVTLGWFALLLSGLVMYTAGRRRNGNGGSGNGQTSGGIRVSHRD